MPPSACQTHIFGEMREPLLSIGQLCDAGCIATFTNQVPVHTRNSSLPGKVVVVIVKTVSGVSTLANRVAEAHLPLDTIPK